MKSVYIVTLGCPKNTVDSENMAYLLDNSGYELAESAEESDIILINTCGFIDSAKEESINTIFEATLLKTKNPDLKIIVTGCLAQRYSDVLKKHIPEIDVIIGTGEYTDIVEILDTHKDVSIENIDAPIVETGRILTTPSHYAYIKLAEGCDKHCTYCIIPKLRGKQRSRKMEDIISEVSDLADLGVKEFILIAQDTGEYGTDLYGERKLPELLYALQKIEKVRWIRILYVYPETISDKLITAMRDNSKVLHYIDIPFQHSNDDILRKMARKTSHDEIVRVIGALRDAMPDIAIRSTFICGFPTETRAQNRELGDFLEEMRLDRVGAFPYSAEEGTVAANMDGQVEESEKHERYEYLMQVQSTVSDEKLAEKIDTVVDVLIEEWDNEGVYVGRSYMDSPEIDGLVYVYTDRELEIGEIYPVLIEDTMQYDMIGRIQ